MWNTVTVQYNPMIEEEWDEHFKVTCEYGYDFWKTVTFPFLDVEYVYKHNINNIFFLVVLMLKLWWSYHQILFQRLL